MLYNCPGIEKEFKPAASPDDPTTDKKFILVMSSILHIAFAFQHGFGWINVLDSGRWEQNFF
jgi:hypothetical protein